MTKLAKINGEVRCVAIRYYAGHDALIVPKNENP